MLAIGWKDGSGIYDHFDEPWLFIEANPEPEEADPGDLDELVTYIGKKPTDVLKPSSPHTYEENANQGPYYKTYNYANNFSLRDGIPTTEDIQNGIECDTWTGLIGIGKRSVTKTYV